MLPQVHTGASVVRASCCERTLPKAGAAATGALNRPAASIATALEVSDKWLEPLPFPLPPRTGAGAAAGVS